MANGEAISRGYDQVLWLLNGMVTEAGASNFFVVWRTREGVIQLVTAPLEDKVILDGVTRRSILQLARERLTIEVVERAYTMDEIVDAIREKRMIEAFAAGTAVSHLPVPPYLSAN
jgi:branched-chain amino acid aminotransferase